jgi:PEGA domain
MPLARELLRQDMKASQMFIPSIAILIASGSGKVPAVLAQTSDVKAASREHFNKGVSAFDAKRFGEAAEEFNAAYQLSPAFAVLYNIGQVNVALGRSVEAVDAYEKYLKQGASAIPSERKQRVAAEIDRQRTRIGTVVVRTVPNGAELRVDGVAVGKTPLPSAVRVTSGRHTIEAYMAEHVPQIRELDVAGRAEIVLELRLEATGVSTAVTAGPVAQPVAHKDIQAPSTAPTELPRREPSFERPVIEKLVIESPGGSRQGAAESSINWQRIGGIVVTMGGVALATWGGIVVYRGTTQSSDAKERLSQATPATTDEVWNRDVDDFNAGKSLSQRGWIAAGVGAGVLLGGIILITTAPEKYSNVALAPWMMAEAGGLMAQGAW